jgi:hypothetical protein
MILFRCGPYVAFGQFAYRVKLVPGKERKGRACKAAIASITNTVKKERYARNEAVAAAAKAKASAAVEDATVAAAGAAAEEDDDDETDQTGPSAERVAAFFDRQVELVKGLQVSEMVRVM